MDKFKVGDRVRIVQSKDESIQRLIGKIGKIVEIDDWKYPYKLEFEDESVYDTDGAVETLYCDEELELYDEHGFDKDEEFEVVLMMHMHLEPKLNPQIENNFKHHSPKEGQPERYEMIRDEAKKLAYVIDTLCPNSDEKDWAIKKLQEAVMWANASIARN